MPEADQVFIVTFSDAKSYRECKQQVLDNGGVIKNDYGEVVMGFAASIPPKVQESIRTAHLAGSGGISTFEPDSVVTTQTLT